jgi:lysophospholipase L1-like esterase
LDGLNPDWVVLNIGTNNFAGTQHARASTPAQVVDGVAAIIDQVRDKSPKSRIILMAIFPRGAQSDNGFRVLINEANVLLRQHFVSMQGVTFLDIGDKFLQPDGTLPKEMMPDGTHPSDDGYKVWASALIEAGLKP